MEAQQIRDSLREFLGEDRYRRFVTWVPNTAEGERWRFWQEGAWEEFLTMNPDCTLTPEGIVEVFSACPDYGATIQRLNYRLLVKTWLRGPLLSVEQVESKYNLSDERLGPDPVVFGFMNNAWLKLKSQMLEGDNLQAFRSPPESWANLAGREGIAIVRNGEVIDMLITILN